MLKRDKKINDDSEIKRLVRERYSSAALGKGSCCGPKICCDSGNTGGLDLGLDMIGDAYQAIDGYLPEADLGLGCGLPTQYAGVKEGDVVLDLGSGGWDRRVRRARIVGKRGPSHRCGHDARDDRARPGERDKGSISTTWSFVWVK